jgi:DNA-directed RNA polymerase subunit RPC12/RpoP
VNPEKMVVDNGWIIEYDMEYDMDIAKFMGHCSVKSIPFPTEITCPIYGYDVELWTDEDETRCYICGYKIFQKEKTIH